MMLSLWLTFNVWHMAATGSPTNGRSQDRLLGLPTLSTPADNPTSAQKIAVGRTLFFDTRLSRDGSVSCASCHAPATLFADEKPVAVGFQRRLGTRNSPSLVNAAFQSTQFWDGRRETLEQQAIDPLLNPLEHGLLDEKTVIAYLNADKSFVHAYASAFPTHKGGVQVSGIQQALAAFERTLIAGDSAFDRYYFGKQSTALDAPAERGLALFKGRALCVACHQINSGGALFSDDRFHSLSVGLKSLNGRLAALTTKLVKRKEQNLSLDFAILNDKELSELGRFAVTLNPADIGKFRTPSLRNVALTAPYMHDGSIATLDAAVEYEIYYRSEELGYPLIMTAGEKADLVAFLKALTSSESALAPLKSMNGVRPMR